MVLTYSQPMPLGTQAPDFTLIDTVKDKPLSLDAARGKKATVMLFLCNHCPYVQHIETPLLKIVHSYQTRGIAFIGISANDVVAYPEDHPDKMRQRALSKNYGFPYLYDPTQKVAKAYGAVCTPEVYIFDQALACIYHGRFDETRPGQGTPATGAELQAALDALLAGKPIPTAHPSMGCNIKWL